MAPKKAGYRDISAFCSGLTFGSDVLATDARYTTIAPS